jgi:hypothetical protein
MQLMGQAGRGATIWKRVRDSSMAPSENIVWSLSGFLWDFKRLCHVAINL